MYKAWTYYIIIITVFFITFMQAIYNYIPETNHVSRVCNVISPVKYVLYFYVSTFRSVCAVPNMAVFL